MRDKEEVLEKFREMRALKLRERMAEYMRRSPANCSSNVRFRVKGKGMIGFCQSPCVLLRTDRGVFACADDETARRCGWYACKNTAGSVEAGFDEVLRSPSRCGDEYPKLAMMIWFLQGSEPSGRGRRLASLLGKMAQSGWRVATFGWW
jgi:hypothetical protein